LTLFNFLPGSTGKWDYIPLQDRYIDKAKFEGWSRVKDIDGNVTKSRRPYGYGIQGRALPDHLLLGQGQKTNRPGEIKG
jgi:hypothetical protein